MSQGSEQCRADVIGLAREHGFVHVRVAAVTQTPRFGAYTEWIDRGHHGEMAYLARNMEVRSDPRTRLEGARSVLALGVPYPSEVPPDPGGLTGRVARYAWGRDYHNLVGKRLRKLKRDLRVHGIEAWGGVDTAPILERAWAEAAGLGVTGKSCVQFLPGQSSYLFLAVLFLDRALTPDTPVGRDHCGSCTRCLVGCPTKAFSGPYALDATKCIAYWTIEAREVAPKPLRSKFGRWLLGCDVCQEVCPHNHRTLSVLEQDLQPRNAWIDLPDLLRTPDEELLERYRGTPLRRPRADGLKRNACVVLGNIGDPTACDVIRTQALTHPAPMVRAAAVWALREMDLKPSLPNERDPSVLRELA